ncbi:hypothetical protein PR244_00380 [Metamycoplasma hyosynoviae]|uniref:HxHSH motif-containing lipoprotein n=1 Tax=Metamycoplasma hyosynoviae TaxID=29559 RepID=UPI00235814F4|nr:hypothetical protein [Metamycoplasma hyosynoviae]MDC8918819.1 hypothetical protein [Metamycoplasma hyosynoviae]
MKRKFLINLPLLSTLSFVPTISMVSCKSEDYEKLLTDDYDMPIETKKYNFLSSEVVSIKEIYDNTLTPLFIEVKNNYFQYKKYASVFSREFSFLKNKLRELRIVQTIPNNQEKIYEFQKKWLLEPNKENKIESDSLFAKYISKFLLIYQDVNAVLVDINLKLDSQEFMDHLLVIDGRLSGKDINIAKLEASLKSIWNLAKLLIYDPNRITKEEDLDKVNLESDKTSHNHSHAIINLTNELGLWHKKLGENYKLEKDIYIAAFKQMISHIVDNPNQLVVNSNQQKALEALSKIFETTTQIVGGVSQEVNKDWKLESEDFKKKGQSLLDELKKKLTIIRDSQGLKNIVDFD